MSQTINRLVSMVHKAYIPVQFILKKDNLPKIYRNLLFNIELQTNEVGNKVKMVCSSNMNVPLIQDYL